MVRICFSLCNTRLPAYIRPGFLNCGNSFFFCLPRCSPVVAPFVPPANRTSHRSIFFLYPFCKYFAFAFPSLPQSSFFCLVRHFLSGYPAQPLIVCDVRTLFCPIYTYFSFSSFSIAVFASFLFGFKGWPPFFSSFCSVFWRPPRLLATRTHSIPMVECHRRS